MSEHTKEPWIYELPDAGHLGIIIGRQGGEVVDGEFTEANARRIVACVNRLAAWSTDEIESGSFVIRTIDEWQTVTEQHDALLSALKDLMALEARGRVMPIGKEWDKARAAIAAVEGE